MKTDWELKEEVIMSIVWETPTRPVAFDIFTINETLENCVTLKQTQDGMSF